MQKPTFALLFLIAMAGTAAAQPAQQIIASGDSVRWSETEASFNRKGEGRVLTLDPNGVRILRLADTVDVRYSNLKQIQRWKKPSMGRVVLLTVAMAAAGALVAVQGQPEMVCDDVRCIETVRHDRRIGNPVTFAAVGGLGGLGLGLFFNKVKPGPWKTVIAR